jgi:hypothetical protein
MEFDMTFPTSEISEKSTHPRYSARTKLRITALCLKFVTLFYAAWVLWSILNWWLNRDQVVQQMSQYLNEDLSSLETWQRMVPLGLDLISWGILCSAIVYAWKFLNELVSTKIFSTEGAQTFMRCARLAITCEAFTQLTRPVIHFVLTANANSQVFHWPFRASDLQSIILCLVLLVFALIYSWALEVAEENKEFI